MISRASMASSFSDANEFDPWDGKKPYQMDVRPTLHELGLDVSDLPHHRRSTNRSRNMSADEVYAEEQISEVRRALEHPCGAAANRDENDLDALLCPDYMEGLVHDAVRRNTWTKKVTFGDAEAAEYNAFDPMAALAAWPPEEMPEEPFGGPDLGRNDSDMSRISTVSRASSIWQDESALVRHDPTDGRVDGVGLQHPWYTDTSNDLAEIDRKKSVALSKNRRSEFITQEHRRSGDAQKSILTPDSSAQMDVDSNRLSSKNLALASQHDQQDNRTSVVSNVSQKSSVRFGRMDSERSNMRSSVASTYAETCAGVWRAEDLMDEEIDGLDGQPDTVVRTMTPNIRRGDEIKTKKSITHMYEDLDWSEVGREAADAVMSQIESAVLDSVDKHRTSEVKAPLQNFMSQLRRSSVRALEEAAVDAARQIQDDVQKGNGVAQRPSATDFNSLDNRKASQYPNRIEDFQDSPDRRSTVRAGGRQTVVGGRTVSSQLDQFEDSPYKRSSALRGDPPPPSHVDIAVGGDDSMQSRRQSAELIVGSAEAIVGQMFNAEELRQAAARVRAAVRDAHGTRATCENLTREICDRFRAALGDMQGLVPDFAPVDTMPTSAIKPKDAQDFDLRRKTAPPGYAQHSTVAPVAVAKEKSRFPTEVTPTTKSTGTAATTTETLPAATYVVPPLWGGSPCEAPSDIKWRHTPVMDWSVDDVVHWVASLLFVPQDVVQEVVKEHAISGPVLLTLTEHELEGLGVEKFGWRRQLALSIRELAGRDLRDPLGAPNHLLAMTLPPPGSPSPMPAEPVSLQPSIVPAVVSTTILQTSPSNSPTVQCSMPTMPAVTAPDTSSPRSLSPRVVSYARVSPSSRGVFPGSATAPVPVPGSATGGSFVVGPRPGTVVRGMPAGPKAMGMVGGRVQTNPLSPSRSGTPTFFAGTPQRIFSTGALRPSSPMQPNRLQSPNASSPPQQYVRAASPPPTTALMRAAPPAARAHERVLSPGPPLRAASPPPPGVVASRLCGVNATSPRIATPLARQAPTIHSSSLQRNTSGSSLHSAPAHISSRASTANFSSKSRLSIAEEQLRALATRTQAIEGHMQQSPPSQSVGSQVAGGSKREAGVQADANRASFRGRLDPDSTRASFRARAQRRTAPAAVPM